MEKTNLRIVRKELDESYDQVFEVYEIDGITYEDSVDIVPKNEGGDNEGK